MKNETTDFYQYLLRSSPKFYPIFVWRSSLNYFNSIEMVEIEFWSIFRVSVASQTRFLWFWDEATINLRLNCLIVQLLWQIRDDNDYTFAVCDKDVPVPVVEPTYVLLSIATIGLYVRISSPVWKNAWMNECTEAVHREKGKMLENVSIWLVSIVKVCLTGSIKMITERMMKCECEHQWVQRWYRASKDEELNPSCHSFLFE